jgi:hypothetical protein
MISITTTKERSTKIQNKPNFGWEIRANWRNSEGNPSNDAIALAPESPFDTVLLFYLRDLFDYYFVFIRSSSSEFVWKASIHKHECGLLYFRFY